MRRFLVTVLLCACGFSQGVQAIESALPGAASLPEFSEENAERLAHFKATNSATTFFDMLESEAFREECTQRERVLRDLPEERAEALAALARALLHEGFEAFDLIRKTPTPRYDRTLARSVCVVLGAKTRAARKHKAILVTSDLTDVRTTAVFLGLAKLMQSFRLEAKPIWMCALSPESTAATSSAAMRELLFAGKDKRPFSSHIALSGSENNAYVNFLGRETTRFEFQEQRRHWIQRDGDTALEASRFVRDALLRAANKYGAWAKSKKSPWLRTTIGPIRCERSLIPSVRNICRFDVYSISRSRSALSEKTLSLVHMALEQTERFNTMLKAPKNAPAVRLSLPKNAARNAVTGNLEKNDAAKAWRTSLGKDPKPETHLSSRFIDSEAASSSALARIPTLSLSCRGQTPEQTRERLTRLAETLLLLSGACDEAPARAP